MPKRAIYIFLKLLLGAIYLVFLIAFHNHTKILIVRRFYLWNELHYKN